MMKNRKRSGGPQTAKGRAKASKNSLKTGVYSARIVLDDEDPKEFEAMLHRFLEDEQPQSMVESVYAFRLAQTNWRMQRFDRFERSMYEQLVNTPVDIFEWMLHLGSDYEAILKKYRECPEVVIQDDAPFYREYSELLKAFTKHHATDPPSIEVLKTQHPRLLALFLTSSSLDQAEFERRVIANKPSIFGGTFWTQVIADARQYLQVRLDFLEVAPKVGRARKAIMDERIRKYLLRGDHLRPLEDMDRLFSRNVAELRREQMLRQARATIEVQSAPKVARLPVAKVACGAAGGTTGGAASVIAASKGEEEAHET